MNKPSLATKKKNITFELNKTKRCGGTKTVVILKCERVEMTSRYEDG
jgi:hypothetical protein